MAGEPANLVVFDPDATWQVQPARLASKSRNTPYVGVELRGQVRHTLLAWRAGRERREGDAMNRRYE